MVATTGTRVFFVESTAHWEAIQRERAQFYNSSGLPASTERTIDPLSRKQHQHHTKPTAQHTSPTNRIALAAGKPGSRRRKRWDNNHLKDNPAAVLYPEDLKPPGHQHSASRILYFQGQLEDDVEDDTTAIGVTDDTVCEDDNNDNDELTTTELPSLTRQMRYGLKRQHIPEGWVSYYEQQLLDFLLKYKQQTKQHISEHDDDILKWEIDDNYLRWLVHAICRYYNINSYSETTSDGRRITFVKLIDYQQLEQPPISFLEYIKK